MSPRDRGRSIERRTYFPQLEAGSSVRILRRFSVEERHPARRRVRCGLSAMIEHQDGRRRARGLSAHRNGGADVRARRNGRDWSWNARWHDRRSGRDDWHRRTRARWWINRRWCSRERSSPYEREREEDERGALHGRGHQRHFSQTPSPSQSRPPLVHVSVIGTRQFGVHVTSGAVIDWHDAVQLRVLGGSHCSPFSTMPLPHTGAVARWMTWQELSHVFPSGGSHCSPASTVLFPQTGVAGCEGATGAATQMRQPVFRSYVYP